MRYLIQLIIVVSSSLSSLPAQEKYPFLDWPNFSATRNGGPIKREPMKVYRSGNQMRIDHEEPGEYHITNLAERSSWVITSKQCTKIPLPDGPAYPFYLAY